ncbi:NAD-dependent succinate-semialdehyde dehydrogenase [Flavisphingomonas formosensis]|uniref:NAD-dependent succinate-semialdehyde dehydrogenase n=1 Tax=Flavisphingomonas formosensis TaxID=861534 RepID=UPI0012F9026D|nr:NAD-dependent succinate-semialdehyde dehydrogenase [Sphingomonas formosensis]
MYPALSLYIDGQFLGSEGRASEPVFDPASGEVLADLPHASAADLDTAIDAATRAFPAWKAMSAYERYRLLRRAADLLRDRKDHIARVMTREQGKVLAEAAAEVATSADILDWYAEEGRRAYGRVVPGRTAGTRQIVLMEPVGPCAAFTPWNFPALTPIRKIGGALGAGCTLILKAAEETPGTALELVRALHDAGVPAGVVNLVFGVPAQVSEHLIAAKAIRKITFTGSTAVGKHLMKLAADTAKRTTMELGGNAPVIVFPDADLDKAVNTLGFFKFRNAGQVCVSPQRFFVHESLYDRFLDGFTEKAKAVKVGNGLAEGTGMGPLANPRRIEAMERVVADAAARGAKVAAGGERIGNQGNFFQPTVLTDLADDTLSLSQEIFGPVVPVVPFASTDEVLKRANSVDMGLASYAFTRSIDTAQMVSEALESGMVGINTLAISTPETPFGGIKESGHGSEGGIEGLQAYLNVKFVAQA